MSRKKIGVIHKITQIAGMMANGSLLTLAITRQDTFGIILSVALTIGWFALGVLEVTHEV